MSNLFPFLNTKGNVSIFNNYSAPKTQFPVIREIIRTIIPLVCDSYSKMGAERRLNINGDLAMSNYIFWNVLADNNTFYWNAFSTYFVDKDEYLIP